jgi:hypothetical protein
MSQNNKNEDAKRKAQAKYGVPPPRQKDSYGGIFNLNPRSLPVSVHGVSKRFEPDPNSRSLVSARPSHLPRGRFKRLPLYFSGQSRPHHYLRFSRNDVELKKLVPPITLERKNVTDVAEDDDDSIYKTHNAPNTANIAPIGGGVRNKKMLFKKRTKQIYEQDPEARKTRERESRPWVLSDKDDVNHFESNFLGTEKCKYVVLEPHKDGFSVTPLQFHYRFDKRLPFKPMTAEEIDEFSKQKKNVEMDRWFLRQKDKKKSEQDKLLEEEGGAYKGPGMKLTDSASAKKNMVKGDIDEMDYDEDFQDDDEAIPELGADNEENKETERSIKRSQLQIDDDDEDDQPKKQSKVSKSNKKMKKIAKKASHSQNSEDDLSSEEENIPFLSSDEEEEENEDQEEAAGKKWASKAEELSKQAYNARTNKQPSANGKVGSPGSNHSGPNSPNGPSSRPSSPQSFNQQQAGSPSTSPKSPKAADKNKLKQRPADPRNPYAPHRPSPLAQVTHINEVSSHSQSSRHGQSSQSGERAQQASRSGANLASSQQAQAAPGEMPPYAPTGLNKAEVINFLRYFSHDNPCTVKLLFRAFKPHVKNQPKMTQEQISQRTGIILEILNEICKYGENKSFYLKDEYRN